MVAHTWIIYCNDHITFELPYLQDQNYMMLCWYSLSEWVREHVALLFAYTVGECLIYEWLQAIATDITHDVRPKIIDTALMLILPWVYPQYYII